MVLSVYEGNLLSWTILCSLQCMFVLTHVWIDTVKPFFSKGNQWSFEKGLVGLTLGLRSASSVRSRCKMDTSLHISDGLIHIYKGKHDFSCVFIGQTVRRVLEHRLIMCLITGLASAGTSADTSGCSDLGVKQRRRYYRRWPVSVFVITPRSSSATYFVATTFQRLLQHGNWRLSTALPVVNIAFTPVMSSSIHKRPESGCLVHTVVDRFGHFTLF